MPVTGIERLLTPAECAAMWKVDPKTIRRWARAGRFPPGTIVTTLGGHRRYREAVILALVNGFDGPEDTNGSAS